MKVIITKSFSKNFLEKNKKYFSLEDLLKQIDIKFHTFIDLSFPYFKFKIKLNNVDFRWILAILIVEEKFILPLNIFLKKDKKFGENIFWEKDWKDILELYEKYISEIEKDEFKIFTTKKD